MLSETPGRIDFLGRGIGADNEEVYGDLLGLDAGASTGVAGRRNHLSSRGEGDMRAPRARRSELATPASSERMCEKARVVRR